MSDIEWADPPPAKGRIRGQGRRQAFVAALRERPGEWAIYDRTAHQSTTFAFMRDYPGVEASCRSNGDGTYTVYVRWVGEP